MLTGEGKALLAESAVWRVGLYNPSGGLSDNVDKMSHKTEKNTYRLFDSATLFQGNYSNINYQYCA